jgi:DNA-binding PadR family transcriptional regulator
MVTEIENSWSWVRGWAVSLSDGERHGYALKQEMLHRTGGKLNLDSGGLYGSIMKMLEQGHRRIRRAARLSPE